MIQRQLFGCTAVEAPAVEMFKCPICNHFNLLSTDPINNDYVALGDVVCSQSCYETAYDLERERQHEIPLYHQPP